ncbi:aldo/keto reductase [Lutispora thermophila]|uniref:Predicted oxidoreductase of the aldo/keto reductase family n=1 Tax=Lutispora thermophila DSM 19022 TaxID=1122184 RepID=A0A1M6D6W9_9FIRM|nr:aldo/keto reductase [Lutispora thermophila]SHI68975.1 Predicted oxidoreductase of the aldo/keto reductase family [Lutispora thermophila DSM 19022]
MKYSVLGKTGLNVSRVSFGGIPIQQLDQEDANSLIGRAIELGINFIDTARGYTVSESLIGEALAGKRSNVFLATKSMARDKEGMRKDVDISLNNLKTDYVDLYQLHNVPTLEDFEKVMAPGGALEALLECKEKGLIKHIGITSHSIEVIEKALEYDIFETIQYPYNAIETHAEEIFKKAYEKNIGIIVMKPFAGGAITNANGALKFILEKEYITCAIPGMCSMEQLEQNVKAADNPVLDESEREELLKEARELGNTFCRRCGYCQPCPVGINIPMMFMFEGYYTRYNLQQWAQERFNTLPVKASECVKCGLCETKCPYNLPIRDMLETVKDLFE